MTRKLIFTVVITLAVFGTLFIRLVIANENNQRLLADYGKQVEQLLATIEESTRQRVEAESLVQQLQAQISRANSRVQSLDRQLQETQLKVDPDYTEVEQRIRAQVTRQLQQQTPATPQNSVTQH